MNLEYIESNSKVFYEMCLIQRKITRGLINNLLFFFMTVS